MLMYVLNFSNVKKPIAEFSLPKDHVDFEKLYRDQHQGRLMQKVMEFTIVALHEIFKDTDVKCEMVTAKSEHRRKGAKHILNPTRSSRCCTLMIEMLLKNNKLKYPLHIIPVKGLRTVWWMVHYRLIYYLKIKHMLFMSYIMYVYHIELNDICMLCIQAYMLLKHKCCT